MERVRLKVEGMSCGHCAAAVKKALSGTPGVCDAVVVLDPPEAVVEFDPKQVTVQGLMEVTADEGYPSSVVS